MSDRIINVSQMYVLKGVWRGSSDKCHILDQSKEKSDKLNTESPKVVCDLC